MPITPSAPKLRQVLSVLAVYANHVVRTEQLIEELWEDKPPPSVTTTLQTYIYQLRKLLGMDASHGIGSYRRPVAGQPALHTLPSGYTLSLDSVSLDANLFEQQAMQGWAELEAGDVESALRTLDEALRLWRGPVLVDVSPGPVLQAEVLRLEELRKSALEHRIDAALRLGQHRQVLGELTALTAQQPTHEGFQGKLMLALYRSGRRSEALRVYQRTRRALASELGVDPSKDLQRLHCAMLAAHGSLDHRSGAEQRHSLSADPPRQLPPEGPNLVARDGELHLILDTLRPSGRCGPAVVCIEGPPGAGKSALCMRAGHALRDQYRDGQFYAVLLEADGRPVDPAEVLGGFLRAVGVPDARIPRSLDERARLFHTWTADRRVLVVLDDLIDASCLWSLMPSNKDSAVLVVSRRRLSEPHVAATVRLGPLDAADGIRVLAEWVGDGRINEDDQGARTLVNLCDGLPMALHTVATRLKFRPHWSTERLLTWLGRRAPHPAAAPEDPLGLGASVARTYRQMPPAVQVAFCRLSTIDSDDVALASAAAMLGTDSYETETLLEELVDCYLIETEAHSADEIRYRFLPSLRASAYRLYAERGLVPAQTRSPMTANVSPDQLTTGAPWR
ncbi:AfsR/SARP family transcriptional regulator [Kibdelosporangium persicum]|uniref:AfsR/SARP family transcriptional regulator n=1 Tax=Kibdelosporangium persicum TaxID=2698649 RepID=UPI0028AF8C66|nr:BTAD domain-containing putative transcriptional regulator [Kibdelosporangium persicum]